MAKNIIKKRPKRTKLEVLDVPIDDLVPDESNPNEMDEPTFDMLVEEIREHGFDEPIHIRPHPTISGKWQIGSGHHRAKAAKVVGMSMVPAVIKHWNDREQKVALAKRNSLRGNFNKEKMLALYKDLAKGRDAVQVQRELGFTDTKKFEAAFGNAMKSLPPKAKKKLAAAKEDIKSMDDLSSVLNKIFKEAGSELDKGYMVFSFGGKEHHYFQIDDATNTKLRELLARCDVAGVNYVDAIKDIVANAELPEAKVVKSKKIKKGKK